MLEKIVIAGNPNVGKSLLFNKIDSIYSTVANYPHTTVEAVRTTLKVGDKQYELIDCPGINSLSCYSEDEFVTRDVLIKENPRVIIQCADSLNLERSLLLASQLMELNIPLILCLNVMDETSKRGVWIDTDKLELLLGIPVVETIASENKGIEELMKRLKQMLENGHAPIPAVGYKKIIEDGLYKISRCFKGEISKAVGLLLLTEDKNIESLVEAKYGPKAFEIIKEAVKEERMKTSKNLASIIVDDRRTWVEGIVKETIKRSKVTTANIPEKIGVLTRHPVWGWPILAGVIYITYLLVGRVAAVWAVNYLSHNVFEPLYKIIRYVTPWSFARDFLVGDYGILSTGLGNALATALPILFMFFLILNIMEDTGYFANLTILIARFVRILGLSGSAIFPLMLGFGCKTMATLTTKMLDSKKERFIAIFLIAFAVPCAPMTGLIMAILGSLSFGAFIIVFGVLIFIEFLAATALSKIMKDDINTDFILEIPPVRFPDIKNVFVKLYYRMNWFMKEVPPLFMIGAGILFFLDKSGALIVIKNILSPLIQSFLSLPSEVIDSFILCLVKREAGMALLIGLVNGRTLSYSQIIVSLIILTSLGPCFANFIAIIKELNIKRAVVMSISMLAASILTGGAVSWIFRIAHSLK